MNHAIALALASPWLIVPFVILWRGRNSPSLDDESAVVPADAPLVSLVIPARNEAHNIERCVRSALASTYPRLEVIAVNDHSVDATGAILDRIAREDSRLKIVVPDALPAGWFGKQWACTSGMAASTGDLVGFMDADTWQSPDMVTRIVNAMLARGSDLVTVAGKQVLGSFWERVIQPQVFGIMVARYGGPRNVNESKRRTDKIANGQCIFVRRETHEALGGHGAVRERVAEDLALAQLYFDRGKTTTLIIGLRQLSTRMYTSFADLNRGWGKNLYAGGRDAMPGGPAMHFLYPLLLLAPSVVGFIPPVLAILGLFGLVSGGLFVWSIAVSLCNLAWWSLVCAAMELTPIYALLYPVGAAALFYISLGSIVRGRRVSWKDRSYVVSR